MINTGGVAEWLKATALKAVRCRKVPQGFESSLLRQSGKPCDFAMKS